MTHAVECDWCGEPVAMPGEPWAQLQVIGRYVDDTPIRVFRDYHAGLPGDETSCLSRALALLDGSLRGADSLDGLDVGWSAATRVSELALPARVVRLLERSGVQTVGQLGDRRAAGRLAGVRGIGDRALAAIDEVLAGPGRNQRRSL